MIVNFADKETRRLYVDGYSKKFPQEIMQKAVLMLDLLDETSVVEDLGALGGRRLHKLSGDLKDFWSISINKQWRIIFRFEDENAFDVKIIDYH
ncbi:type II toxin-antitoxin system RelE/ParE family toxin [Limisalsivibrio acetivorans]|uniref:type II toxin-antitoxin system RelE/ParE family toxin n=1 Tax=Limisalsivibrio acetivorans TaxID=1304888 RepID=UPI00042981BC|nr:type II toxin-antitoxin system RelE/ParE family toxin [Limisalsivibrio acetivorans]